MKKKKIILLSVLLLAVVTILLIIFYPVKKSDTDLADIIPKTASVVIRVNTQSLMEKADYKPLKNQALKTYLDNARKEGSDQVQDNINDLEKFLKNPDSFGIDVKENCFIYNDSAVTGVIWSVNNWKKIKNALSDIFGIPEDLIKKKADICTASLNNYINVTWDKSKVLILVNTKVYMTHMSGKPVDLEAMGKKQIRMPADSSIVSNNQFNRFLKDSKDLSVFLSYQALKDYYLSDFSDLGLNDISMTRYDFHSIYAGLYLSFDKGKISVSQKMYYRNKKQESEFLQYLAEIMRPINGKQVKYFTSKPLFLISFNVKGKELSKYITLTNIGNLLNGNGYLPEAGNKIDIQSILSNVDGDITFAVNDINLTQKEIIGFRYAENHPEYTLMADVDHADSFLDTMVKKMSGMKDFSISKISDHMYSILSDGQKFYVGTKENKMFYYSANENMVKNILLSIQTEQYNKEMKNRLIFITGNPFLASNFIESKKIDTNTKKLLKGGLSMFTDYNYSTTINCQSAGEIKVRNSGQNSMASIFQYIDKVITFYTGKIKNE